MDVDRIICDKTPDALHFMPDDSIDLIVTDPPYGIDFMGKAWDKALPTVEAWRECLRVLKPGAFAFVMCIPRQDCQARMILNLEEAGFDISFTDLEWTFATGFPKSGNVKKMLRRRLLEPTWKQYLGSYENVNIAEQLSLKDLIEAGLLTSLKNSVVKNAPEKVEVEKLTVFVQPADDNFSEAHRIQGIKHYIVVDAVNQSLPQSKCNVRNVVLSLHGHNLPSKDIKITFVHMNVQADLCEQVTNRIKAGGILKTGNGKWQSLKGMDINAAGAELIDALKPIILSQLKTILNSGMMLPTELLFATNVIITKSIMECLLTSTVDMLKELQELDGAFCGAQFKPCREKIIVAMKPLSEKTYLDQALTNGKGCTWLDAGRIPYDAYDHEEYIPNRVVYKDGINHKQTNITHPESVAYGRMLDANVGQKTPVFTPQGRFAPNLLVSDDVLNDGRVLTSGLCKYQTQGAGWQGTAMGGGKENAYKGDSGSYSRYFSLDAWAEKNLPESVNRTFPFLIVPKASKSEKNAGLDDIEPKAKYSDYGLSQRMENGVITNERTNEQAKAARNNHPTVKPIKLMSYLIAIGSRPCDIVLDPYAGTGTTGIAAALQGRHYICIEMDEYNCTIAEKRIAWHVGEAEKAEAAQLKLF